VYDPTQLINYTSPLTASNYATNHLANAGNIAFSNGAPSVWVMQINDSIVAGQPTANQVKAAIDYLQDKQTTTDIVVVGISEDIKQEIDVYTMNHVVAMCSQLESKYRRAWFGLNRSKDVGDPDTPNTLVHTATKTLQPGGTSPGRGRLFLVAPTEASIDITLEDESEINILVDGSYIAVAVAATFTGTAGPWDPLMTKTITGFKISDFETYLKGERYTLAGNGVTVVTLDGGNFKLLDPLSTEAGAGKLPQFEEPGASESKDAVVLTVNNVLDTNCKGVVPLDPFDFITDIKMWIKYAIEANINAGYAANYTSNNGTIRKIDMTSDIKVEQSASDQRTYLFKYWYKIPYTAKRFFGEYSVDNPFFNTTA
jgi:hypothetical protein